MSARPAQYLRGPHRAVHGERQVECRGAYEQVIARRQVDRRGAVEHNDIACRNRLRARRRTRQNGRSNRPQGFDQCTVLLSDDQHTHRGSPEDRVAGVVDRERIVRGDVCPQDTLACDADRHADGRACRHLYSAFEHQPVVQRHSQRDPFG